MNWIIIYSSSSPNYIKSIKVKKEIETLTNGV